MRLLKRTIHSLLKKLGYRLVKISGKKARSVVVAKDDEDTPSNINVFVMEFMGPTGVGKTTLVERIKNQTAAEWYYRENLSSLTPTERDGVLSGGLHWEILFDRFLRLDGRNLDGYLKTKMMRYLAQVMLHDLHLQNGVPDKGFLLDEGICHNFSKELNALPENEFNKIMAGRALVYLAPKNPSTVVKRIRERAQNSGKMVSHQKGLSDDELCLMAELQMNQFKMLISRARAIGIPVCTVYAEDDFDRNAETILGFEKTLSRSQNVRIT